MTRTRTVCFAVLLAAPVLADVAQAQWASIGTMPAPRREGDALVFRNSQAVASVTAITPEIVRVRLAPGRAFGRDHSYAVVTPASPRPTVPITVATARGATTLETGALRVVVHHAPFRVAIFDRQGNSLDEDDPLEATARSGYHVRVAKRLREDEHVYGFGEKGGPLDKRGWQLGGVTYAMWNSDTFAYDGSTDPLYVSVPFYMVLRSGRAHGIFLDNTWRTTFDVGHTRPGILSFGVEGGELNYYFIDGPTPKDVLARYTMLTGRVPLPPRWALGYHQCRWSYYPESRVRFIAENFRERKIPADVIWLDIHYQDNYKPFTWDAARFPNPAGMIRDLGAQGFKVVTIVDPHPKKEPGYAPYDQGLAGNHFVRRADGAVFEGPVWPSQAAKDPGNSVFPDFSRPATREWWGGLYEKFVGMGVAGIWNDMNEPAIFNTPGGTMPLDAKHDNEGVSADHRAVHNVYGMQMTRATFDGLARLRPDERPFVLSRASFAGGQRYAAVWPGDNVSEWMHFQATLPMLMGLGLSGFSFVGSDIGGFAGVPSAELFTRWLQAGVFYPFMRTHTTDGTPDQEPWSYGTRHEAINRRAIELRYELLPTLYNAMREASETGVPAMRPVFLEYPELPTSYGISDEFFFGGDLLVAPVLKEGATSRGVNLPPEDWYDFWTGARVAGNRLLTVPVTIESLPIFVRAGAFIFRQPVIQHTGEMTGQPLSVWVYPASSSERTLYEDDGHSLQYRQGQFMTRRFSQSRGPGGITIAVGAPQGAYRPAPRTLEFVVRVDGPVSAVSVGGSPVARAATVAEFARQATAWWAAEGFVRVKLPDRFEAVTLELR